jgi:hypothetical protein|tara:strand:- start:213 stop:407 length:195 start_codon:yes stop_codon:yes gene_type:complete
VIKAGDIVYLAYLGGLKNNEPKTDELGLVIKEHQIKGEAPQLYVQFDQKAPKWYYQHNLFNIKS